MAFYSNHLYEKVSPDQRVAKVWDQVWRWLCRCDWKPVGSTGCNLRAGHRKVAWHPDWQVSGPRIGPGWQRSAPEPFHSQFHFEWISRNWKVSNPDPAPHRKKSDHTNNNNNNNEKTWRQNKNTFLLFLSVCSSRQTISIYVCCFFSLDRYSLNIVQDVNLQHCWICCCCCRC